MWAGLVSRNRGRRARKEPNKVRGDANSGGVQGEKAAKRRECKTEKIELTKKEKHMTVSNTKHQHTSGILGKTKREQEKRDAGATESW